MHRLWQCQTQDPHRYFVLLSQFTKSLTKTLVTTQAARSPSPLCMSLIKSCVTDTCVIAALHRVPCASLAVAKMSQPDQEWAVWLFNLQGSALPQTSNVPRLISKTVSPQPLISPSDMFNALSWDTYPATVSLVGLSQQCSHVKLVLWKQQGDRAWMLLCKSDFKRRHSCKVKLQ